MSLQRFALLGTSIFLASCAANLDNGTIGQLKKVRMELADEKIEGGIEKAMQGYQKFLAETPVSAMTPEAIRRLADLKIEKEYGVVEGGVAGSASRSLPAAASMERPPVAPLAAGAPVTAEPAGKAGVIADIGGESTKEFEQRASQSGAIASTASAGAAPLPGETDDLSNTGATEAIALYKQLLEQYPLYERNDQVLYQMSRAYEELGDVDEAMNVMNRIVKDYPASRYADEIHFRRGEYYFTRKKFRDAESAYAAIVQTGDHSTFYEIALYKLGWTFYKQEMHEEGLHQFVALLDHKVKTGYDFSNQTNEFEQKRIEDTYRVISLSFSALGGPDAVVDYFDRKGKRSYEVDIYSNLGEHYLEKRRYADAAASYKAFVKRNPYHKVAPHFDMRVIDIYKRGGFPRLVIDANKEFATSYGLKSAYWTHFDVTAYPDVLGYLKANLKELANHFHALYQEKTLEKDRPENFREASHWYHEYLESFPKDVESPAINYQLADLLLENRDFGLAALAYETTAYDYPLHEKSAGAGYAAVYAHRENLAVAAEPDKETVKRAVIRSSLRFADAFMQHEKAALVMGAALEDIYGMKEYEFAATTGRKMIANFPNADQPLRRAAWLVVAHSSFELNQYTHAEEAYLGVLQLTAADDKSREEIVENLAASIYKQGEQANAAADYRMAAEHFLRVGRVAPDARIRATADYDGAAALIQLKDWDRAAEVLLAFRSRYPGHKLQADVTRKIALVYQEAGKLALAAAEYERIETETKDEAIRREALLLAAELYLKAGDQNKGLQVYRRFIGYFPQPVEMVVETRNKIADILKARNDKDAYLKELQQIVDADARAGAGRTDRTRYLGAVSALVLTEPLYAQFADIQLLQPFDKSLKKKKAAMKAANDAFGKLVGYEVGDVTAAATYYIAEAYFNFSESLKKSERPRDLDELEAEQYEEALDEQSYPFEEKSIQIHEKNLRLMDVGVYNPWIEKSLARLATIMPGRYAKFEESSGFIESMDVTGYQSLTDPAPVVPVPAVVTPPAENQTSGAVDAVETASPPEGVGEVAGPSATAEGV